MVDSSIEPYRCRRKSSLLILILETKAERAALQQKPSSQSRVKRPQISLSSLQLTTVCKDKEPS